ncbi:OLC1v1020112C1 [Oldenlandia corymbosa var. corymbosa]|uniref:OLC1v1020112C1 n=1 Tax=Oldenlandia corymbosa var. corymbosa TaxID=529605 RepID=A0AAV1EFL6_OLDCO|nr:OLC1v1020112C1 [Oldenlandia corymbosa var. corymbosa]
MGSLETIQVSSRSNMEQTSGPRISFSAEFLDESNFITISPKAHAEKELEKEKGKDKEKVNKGEFEFLSSKTNSHDAMITADELFFEGKLLPFWQIHHAEKLNKISLKTEQAEEGKNEAVELNNKEEPRISWFLDDDPSPRPPKCTVLWKELLRLKKQRASSLSLTPSSSTSSSSSSSSNSLTDLPPIEEGKERVTNREKHIKRIKKGLERTRSASMRIRPMVNVPICTQAKNASLPPMFSIRKGRIESTWLPSWLEYVIEFSSPSTRNKYTG